MRALIAICLLAACGNKTSGTVDAPTGTGDVGMDTQGSDAAGGNIAGSVSIVKARVGTTASSDVELGFHRGSLFGPVKGMNGPCTLYGSPPAATALSAGVIDITGTAAAVTATPSSPPVKYAIAPMMLPANLYTTGATLSVHAAGGDVPAFDGTVTGPAPLAGFTLPTSVSRSGYTATWTAGTGPGIWLILGVPLGTSADIIICKLPDNGSFQVTSQTFGLIPAQVTQTAVGLTRVAESDLMLSGGAMVTLYAVDEISNAMLIPLNP